MGRAIGVVVAGLLALAAAGAAAAQEPGFAGRGGGGGLRAASDQIVGQAVQAGGVHRAIVAISRHGRRAYFGYSGTGEAPIGQDAIVEIASVTKVFTTALAAEAFDAGRIQPNASIQAYLPEVRLGRCAARITPLELANFTSGLPRDAPIRSQPLQQQAIQAYSMRDFLGWVASASPRSGCNLPAPYLYSNASVGVLAPILANAEGRSWQELVAERIAGPLGMVDTAINPAGRGQVQGYHADGTPSPRWPVFAWYAAGGLRSTAQDMLSFGEAALGHEVVNGRRTPPALRQALSNAMRSGLTWVSQSDGQGGTVTLKDGGDVGFGSVIVVDRAKDCTIFIVANKQGFPAAALGARLMKAIAP